MNKNSDVKFFRAIKYVWAGCFLIPFFYSLNQGVGLIFEKAMGYALFASVIALLLFAVLSISRSPGNSVSKVMRNVGLFFALCILLTVIIVGLGYVFHAPGINPL